MGMVWKIGVPFQFRYSRSKDVGISVYLIIVVTFFYFEIPLHIIQPLFIADPMGAMVGKGLTKLQVYNPKWIGKKTIAGTLAVMISTVITLTYGTLPQKAFIALLSGIAEATTLDYD